MQIHQKLQWRSNLNLGVCEKTLGFQIIVTQDSAPNDNFSYNFGFILSSPNLNPAVLWPIAHVRCIKILTWLRGFLGIFLYLVWFSIFGLVFYIWFGFLCAQVYKGNCKTMEWWKIAILTLKSWSHVRIVTYRMWAIKDSFPPIFLRIQHCLGRKGCPNTFDLNCRKTCFFPFPQTKMQNLLVFHAMGNILREPQSGCSHSPVPFLSR